MLHGFVALIVDPARRLALVHPLGE